MAQRVLFRIKVKLEGKTLLRVFHFFGETWEEALAFARQKGEPVAIAVER
jgi:hypothetical protein